jgi:lipoprotein-anchoring transpeptidase ErfK/SrfK
MLQKKIKIMKCLLLTLFLTTSLSVVSISHAQVNNNLPPKAMFAPVMQDLAQRFSQYLSEYVIVIIASEQKQYLLHNGEPVQQYTISTSEFGTGNKAGSNKTPLGVHIIKKKYGSNAKIGTIFKARTNTGRIAKILTEAGKRSKDDNVTTRILWLSGLEKGINKGGNVDSYRRYIYIHGTDEEGRLGTPASHGCIRMKNEAVIDLYKNVSIGTLVVILP